MCIVSRTNNYVFYHIPKCGGTSLSSVLPKKETVNLIKSTHVNYYESKLVFEINNESNWFSQAKKFAIVRNPYARTESLYKYIKKHSDHHLHTVALTRNFTQFCYYLKYIGSDDITSCFTHLCDENSFIDSSLKIFKLEEIDKNLEEISELVGSKIKYFPNINSTSMKLEKTNESDFLIKDLFADDFINFYPELS